MTPNFSLHHHFWGTRFTASHDWGSNSILSRFSLISQSLCAWTAPMAPSRDKLGSWRRALPVHRYTLLTVAKHQGMMTASHWQQRAPRELTSDLQHHCSLKRQPYSAGIPSISASAYLGWKHSCRNKSRRSDRRTEFLVSWTWLRFAVFASHLLSGKLHLPHPDKLLFQQSCPRALCHQEVCELKSEREVRVHQLPALSTK